MSSKPRHRKPSVDFVAKAQQFSQVEERLGSAEHSLFERERTLDSNERPHMFFEMGIRPTELDWISAELGEGIKASRRQGLDETKLLDRFSRLTISALVNAGNHTSRDNSFWPVFWEQLDVPESPELASFIRHKLSYWLRKFHLEVFDGINLGSTKYVMQATLHAGIPTSEMNELVADSKALLIDDDDPTDGDREGMLLVKKYMDQGKPRTLSRLSSLKPSLASYMFARVVEYVYYSQINKGWYTDKDFEGTNGLPENTFAELRQFLFQGEQNTPSTTRRPQAIAQEQPYLKLDPDAGKVLLVLPAVPDEGEDLRWTIDAEHDTFHISPRFDNSNQQFRREEIVLTSPARHIHVTQSITQETTSLRFLGSDFPVAFFGSDFRFCDDQQQISRNNLFALAPANTHFSDANDPFVRLVEEELQFISWHDWRVFVLENLLKTRALNIRIPANGEAEARSTTRSVRSPGTRGPEWNLQVKTVTDVLGSDVGLIYKESPRLKLPHDDAQWEMRIFYLPPVGEESLVIEYEQLEELEGEEFAIFDDSFEDAWVGRYRVELIKDGLVVTQKFINIAEGFQLNVNYGTSGSFRYPNINLASNRYNKVYFEALTSPDKPIQIPFTGTRAVGDTEESESFLIASGEGYELEIQLVPKMMRFSIDRTDIPHSWNTFPSVVPSRYIDESGQVKIQFPQRVEGSVFLLVSDSRARNSIVRIPMQARRNRQLFAVPVSELKHSFSSEDLSLTISVGWYKQTAKELWRLQNTSRQDQKRARQRWGSFSQFDKQYQAFDLDGPAHTSTIMQLDSSVFTGTAEVVDSTIMLNGSSLGKALLRGHLWPLTAANQEPFSVSFDANRQASLPDSLVNAGPLALEITAQNDSYRGQQPKSPTDRALVVSQQGYYISPDGEGKILGLAYKLSGISKTVTASPDEYTDLWERLNPLRYIRYQTNEAREVVEHFENFCRQSFSQDPRALLEALGRSNVRVERQISLAIRFGLFSLTFGNLKDTLDEFHPVPWVGVLGEMNDVVTLSTSGKSSSRSSEFSDSLQFIQEAGGSALCSTLSGDFSTEQDFVEKILNDVSSCILLEDYSPIVTGLSDINGERLLTDNIALRHGWAELLRNRGEIESLTGLKRLKELAINLVPNIDQPETYAYASRLWNFAEKHSDPTTNLWTWVPLISVVLSHVSRAHAHGMNGTYEKFRPLQSANLRRWSELAQLCPTLTTNDLLREEARQLVASNGALTEIQSNILP